MSKPPSKSALSRSLKIFGAAAKIAGKEAGKKLRDIAKEKVKEQLDERAPEFVKLRIEQAQILTQNLSQLKGAAMKAGQLLSLEATDLLPPEAVEVLSRLQGDADPVDFATMQEVLNNELGREKSNSLTGLGSLKIHAASIGQVFEANLSSEVVAVKVQYPGVSESIHSDLKALKRVVEPLLLATGRRMKLDETFDEVAEVLSLETDYLRERDMMEEYRTKLQGDQRFLVPQSIDDYCTQKVLTMTWIDSLSLDQWLNSSPTQQERNEIACRIIDLYTLEFFSWGLVQTDPNMGNFGVIPSPLTLVVLDFGSTKKYERNFINEYKKLVTVFAENNHEQTTKAAEDFGLLDPRESDEAKIKFSAMLSVALEPFFTEQQPFAFSDEDYSKRTREAILAFSKALKYSPPPRQILFLHRKLGGIFNLCKKLNVRIDLRPYWQRMIN